MIQILHSLQLLAASFIFTMGIFVLKQNPKAETNVSFSIAAITTSLWLFFYFLAYIVASHKESFILFRIGYTFVIFMGVGVYHFVISYIRLEEEKRWAYIWYFVGVLLVLTLWLSNSFISNELFEYPWGLYPKSRFFQKVYLSLTIFIILRFQLILLKKYAESEKSNDLSERIRIKFVFWSVLFLSLTSIDFLPNYGIPIYPVGFFFAIAYSTTMAYAILRHQLFNLKAIANSFQREKLATIGLLAASVNHEIRNPLYVAKSNLESDIEKAESDGRSSESLEVSKKSLAAINRALDVITKLNRFSKPAAESAENQAASVWDAVQNVFDLISYEFKLDHIKIVNHIQKSAPQIKSDQRQLEEILFNLMVNACHAMSNGGTLTLSSTLRDSRLIIEIADTGHGISEDQMKHLFEPFHTTKGEKGTGLGLYITKQLVERNGGKISVKSNSRGTSFTLEFRSA